MYSSTSVQVVSVLGVPLLSLHFPFLYHLFCLRFPKPLYCLCLRFPSPLLCLHPRFPRILAPHFPFLVPDPEFDFVHCLSLLLCYSLCVA